MEVEVDAIGGVRDGVSEVEVGAAGEGKVQERAAKLMYFVFYPSEDSGISGVRSFANFDLVKGVRGGNPVDICDASYTTSER